MRIHQFLTSYSYGDAIGNEAFEIRNYLREQGHESDIYALNYHPKYADQIISYLEYDRSSDPDNIVIFHFSIGSPVSKKFLDIVDKKVIIYHNITPYQFFLDYHRVLAKDCYAGRQDLSKFVGKIDMALGVSQYNERELRDLGFEHTGVLPLVMDFSKFDSPNVPVIEELMDDGKTNILYVGRIIPNKRIEDILRIFQLYQQIFNPNSRLIIIGEYRGFERYLNSLFYFMNRLGIKDVHFTWHIPEDELVTYYKLAHVYLHMSEHEGFCAPIPESFYRGIPVVAYNAGAIEETMGGAGLMVNSKRFADIAGLIDRIVMDDNVRDRILASQTNSLQRFTKQTTGKILLEYLESLAVKR